MYISIYAMAGFDKSTRKFKQDSTDRTPKLLKDASK